MIKKWLMNIVLIKEKPVDKKHVFD